MNRNELIAMFAIILFTVVFGYMAVAYIVPLFMKDPDHYFIYDILIIALLLTIPYIILKILFASNKQFFEPDLKLKDLPKNAKKIKTY